MSGCGNEMLALTCCGPNGDRGIARIKVEDRGVREKKIE